MRRNYFKRRAFLKAIIAGTASAPHLLCQPLAAMIGSGFQNTSASAGKDPFRPVTRVEEVGGVPTFTLDGKPYMVPVMETYDAEGRYFSGFARAGTRVFSMNTNTGEDYFGRGWAIWPAPDKWDFAGLDKWVHRALATGPDALIMPRVYVCEPQWWLEQNPSEVELWDNGSELKPSSGYAGRRMHASLASEKWREAMANAMRHLLDHIHNSDYVDRVFGYLLAGLNTEEWWHWGLGDYGYSELTRKAFQDWLRRKYGTMEALRTAWNRSDVTFETVTVPSREEREYRGDTFRDPSRQMNVIDFYGYWNEVIPDTIDYFAGIIKKATNRTKVVGAFYAMMYAAPDAELGHNGLVRYLASPDLDYVLVTSGFGNRTLGGCDYGRETPLSVQLHGKVFYFDNDYSSHLNTEQERQRMLAQPGLTEAEKERIKKWLPKDFGDQDSRGTNTREDIALFRRVAGFTLCSGMFQSFFDIAHGSYDSPELWAEVAKLNKMFERSVQYDRSSNAEILVVADETSCSYSCRGDMNGFSAVLAGALYHSQFRLAKLGTSFDQILVDDLKLVDMSSYKLVIFLNAYHLTNSQRELIEKTVKGGNRTVMWCYAPGLFQEATMSPDLMRDTAGMKLTISSEETLTAPRIQLTESSHPLSMALRKVGVTTMGAERTCRMISVDDPEATSLGTLPGTDKTTLAVKSMDTWTSVYAITADLAPDFYRELARQAGIHIYSERNDTFYVNKSYICLHASGVGRRTIKFPWNYALWDAITEEQLAEKTSQYSHDLAHGETIILRLEEV